MRFGCISVQPDTNWYETRSDLTLDSGFFATFSAARALPFGSSSIGGEMKLTNLGTKIAGAVFAISILFGVGLTAQAQNPYPDDRYRRDDRRDQDRYRDQDRDRDQRRRDNDGRYNRRNRFNDDYPDWGGTFDLRQTALNAGANAGIKAGRDDRRKNRRYEFRDEGAYQKATSDYSSKLGDRGLYQQYYRIAFEHAYADGYAGY